jgi:hypothetical protein
LYIGRKEGKEEEKGEKKGRIAVGPEISEEMRQWVL